MLLYNSYVCSCCSSSYHIIINIAIPYTWKFLILWFAQEICQPQNQIFKLIWLNTTASITLVQKIDEVIIQTRSSLLKNNNYTHNFEISFGTNLMCQLHIQKVAIKGHLKMGKSPMIFIYHCICLLM